MILNPYANRWKAARFQTEAEQALKDAGVDCVTVLTEHPGHGIELAEKAVRDGFTSIIAAGGDGSINEVVNGIARACLEDHLAWPTLGMMPLGSANDLVANLGLPADLASAARTIAQAKVRKMDLCTVSFALRSGEPFSSPRYFVNNSAIGLEPTITLIQQEISWVHGSPRYLLATVMGVLRNPQWNMRLVWDDGEYEGPSTLVTVGNNKRTGGLFYMTPNAEPFDGKLTFVYGHMDTRRKILALLPRTMKPGAGSYVEHPSIHEVHSSRLRISVRETTPIHTDGEIQASAVQEIDYTIVPQILPVIIQ
jgi:diacylglycerol kinase (ATP)